MVKGQKEAFDVKKAIERMRDMIVARQMLVSVSTTTFKLKKLDTQIRLASHRAADGIEHLQKIRQLEYDERTKWTLLLSECRLKLFEMEAPTLQEALGDVEDALRDLLQGY